MTYKKPLKAFRGTTLKGIQFVADDTATSRLGSDAISSFEAHKTIKTEAENRKMLVPFHAVKSAMYGISTEDAERTDPYCGGGTDGDSYTIRFEVNPKAGFTPSVLLKCDDDVSELVSLPYEMKVVKGESFTPLGVVIEECEDDCAYFKPASNEYEYDCPTMVADRDMTFIWTRQDLED